MPTAARFRSPSSSGPMNSPADQSRSRTCVTASNFPYPGPTSFSPFGQAPDPLIAFGPAAAPRWFDNDSERLSAYLDLIQDSGGSAIECVLLPGPVSIEQRRVHVSDTLWPQIVREVGRRNMIVTLHWPLLPEFHFSA